MGNGGITRGMSPKLILERRNSIQGGDETFAFHPSVKGYGNPCNILDLSHNLPLNPKYDAAGNSQPIKRCKWREGTGQ